MFKNFMTFFRRRPNDTNGYAQNGCAPRRPAQVEKSDAEIARRMAEEARRYESDLRRLAKT
jgi:hypothetical protein